VDAVAGQELYREINFSVKSRPRREPGIWL
jgi:hypothetical protein